MIQSSYKKIWLHCVSENSMREKGKDNGLNNSDSLYIKIISKKTNAYLEMRRN
jgi:hypothetical protein